VPSKFVGAGVLEIACSTGYWTQFIAPVARHITALDAAPGRWTSAGPRLQINVEFVVGDAYDPRGMRTLTLRSADSGFRTFHGRGSAVPFCAQRGAATRRHGCHARQPVR
jgi:demethylmenaquinone methyltransferase/2-methoxy-6-polyprenyl-1,4-benzoquinol methylase